MAFFDTIKDRLRYLDTASFYRYLGIFFFIVLLGIGWLGYYYFSRSNKLLKQFNVLNNNRLQTREILTRYAIVQEQREKVENLLTQDKTFFIGQYFSDLMKQQNIPAASIQQQEPITEEVSEDYNQIKLAGSIAGLNMKQLAELLNAIEQEERIYIDKLELKDDKNKKIDVSLIIATLEPKQQQAE